MPFTDRGPDSRVSSRPSSSITDEQKLKFGGVFYDNDFLANSYYQNLNSKTYTANYALQPGRQRVVNFRLNGYRNDVDDELRTTDSTGPRPAAARPAASIDDKGWGFDATNTSRFNLGAVHVQSEYGYEYFFDDVDSFNTRTPGSAAASIPAAKAVVDGLFSETTFTLRHLRSDRAACATTRSTLKGSVFAQPATPRASPPGPYTVDKRR